LTLSNILILLATILASFPYTKLISIDVITQPYAIIIVSLGLVGRFLNNKRVKLDSIGVQLVIFAVLGCVAYGFSFFINPDFGSIKWFVAYVSPAVFYIAFKEWIKYNKTVVFRAVVFSIATWFAVGLIQKTISPTFLTGLVGERHSEASENLAGTGRGVFGLAHEPTHHGFHVILMVTVAVLIEYNIYLLLIGIVSSLFFAMSSSVALCFIISLGISVFRWRLSDRLSLVFFLVVCFPLLYILLPEESRMREIMYKLLDSPMDLVLDDYSANMRIGGLLGGIMSSLDNFLLPAGISHRLWLIDIDHYYSRFPWIVEISAEGWPSGYIIIVYQLGVFSLLLLSVVKKSYESSFLFKNSVRLFAFTSLNIFIFQFYLTAPYFGILLAAISVRFDEQSKTQLTE